jgi:hypothetical protein
VAVEVCNFTLSDGGVDVEVLLSCHIAELFCLSDCLLSFELAIITPTFDTLASISSLMFCCVLQTV